MQCAESASLSAVWQRHSSQKHEGNTTKRCLYHRLWSLRASLLAAMKRGPVEAAIKLSEHSQGPGRLELEVFRTHEGISMPRPPCKWAGDSNLAHQ